MTSTLTPEQRAERLERARYLLRTVRHAAMATVTDDGSPHNTPYRFLAAPDLAHMYWSSHPNSVHSRNIIRTGQLFIVLYEADKRGGLFIKAKDGHVAERTELQKALEVYNQKRISMHEDPIKIDYYQGNSPQRLWAATPTSFWINASAKDANGLLIEDHRYEVSAQELLQ